MKVQTPDGPGTVMDIVRPENDMAVAFDPPLTEPVYRVQLSVHRWSWYLESEIERDEDC